MVLPLRARTRLAGVSGLGFSANARLAASAFDAPGDEKQDLAAGLQGGRRHGDPVDERLEPGLGGNDALARLQGRGVREERRDVPVRADAQQQEVERVLVDLPVVGRSGLILAELALDAVHRGRARARDGRAACASPVRSSTARRRAARSARHSTTLRPCSSRAPRCAPSLYAASGVRPPVSTMLPPARAALREPLCRSGGRFLLARRR